MPPRRIALLAVLLALAGAAGWLYYALFTPYRGYTGEGVFVEIPAGATGRTIAHTLAGHGVVRSAAAFELLYRWRAPGPLQAGEYYFSRPMTALQVYRDLAEGRVYMRAVTIPEGLAMFEIAERVEREGLCRREEFLAAARDPSPVRDLAPKARNLEGFLSPATYPFPRRARAADVVATMVARFRQVWDALPAEGRNPRGLSVLELVTLASLVEKETGRSDERPVIAGVFYNRLQRGIALQCDPTVIYALELSGRYRGKLYARDLRFNSPYNTYRYRGLPPGPIANPGEAALRAALYPARVEYLYFVSNAEGGHHFSRTLREHLKNVARYRRRLAELAQNSPGNGASPEPSPGRKRNPPGSRP